MARKCVNRMPNATLNVIEARKNPRYFGSEISLKYIGAVGLSTPTQNPVKIRPNSSQNIELLIDMMHQPITNGTFRISNVILRPKRSIKNPASKQPKAIGNRAIEAENERKNVNIDTLIENHILDWGMVSNRSKMMFRDRHE